MVCGVPSAAMSESIEADTSVSERSLDLGHAQRQQVVEDDLARLKLQTAVALRQPASAPRSPTHGRSWLSDSTVSATPPPSAGSGCRLICLNFHSWPPRRSSMVRLPLVMPISFSAWPSKPPVPASSPSLPSSSIQASKAAKLVATLRSAIACSEKPPRRSGARLRVAVSLAPGWSAPGGDCAGGWRRASASRFRRDRDERPLAADHDVDLPIGIDADRHVGIDQAEAFGARAREQEARAGNADLGLGRHRDRRRRKRRAARCRAGAAPCGPGRRARAACRRPRPDSGCRDSARSPRSATASQDRA